MSLDIVLTFFMVSLLLVVSPGPNGVLILKTVSMHGKKSAMLNLSGMFGATYLHGALSFFGLSAIILSSASLFMFIKIMGALYLLFLGIKSIYTLIQSKRNVQKSLEKQIQEDQSIKKVRSHKLSFMEGFLTQILNPKVSMFYLAALPQFVDFTKASTLNIFTLVSIHALTNFLWFTLFIIVLGKTAKAFKSNFIKDSIQGLTGVVFIYLSYKILTVESSK